MDDFFSPPPPAPTEPRARHRPPVWSGPPHGTLPGVVPLELVLARSDRAAVCVSRLCAYPTGLGLDLLVFTADEDEDDELLDPLLFGPRHHRARGRAGKGLPDEMLRFGVQFSDGRRATNIGARGGVRPDGEPTGPVLSQGGGGGGGGRWHQSLFLWPLPPPGPLLLACEWPAAGIPLTGHELDSAPVHDAARRAQTIFEQAPGGDADAATWSTVQFASGSSVREGAAKPPSPGTKPQG
ncbi:MAG TPA: hypothetical protein VKV27_13790 [Solirubrobacteraceae bacterium]|nr:hypothetical protein [Solirubrobacteraceae bacterium]